MNTKISVKQAVAIDHTNAYLVTVANDLIGTEQYVVWTGNDGKGLWLDEKQIEGRAQFDAGKNPREAIRRYFGRM
jgi:hypothetical protein